MTESSNENENAGRPKREFGVAFGGGGIRSAAFCSGVLRRLIDKEKEPDVVSCVSGGGYTGSAYVQWKLKNKDKAVKDWANEFFNQMKENTGHYCNWSAKGCTGCCDCIILFFLFLFILLVPVIIFLAFSFPIAFLVKLFYGHFVDGKSCRRNAHGEDCKERKLLFVVSLVIFIFFHLVEHGIRCCEDKKNFFKCKTSKAFLKLGQLISGNTFAFTFFPWFINDFMKYMEWYETALTLLITAIIWFFVPVLRKYSSLVIFVYIYSYVVYWHVYEGEILIMGKYTDDKFRAAMVVSLAILGLLSIFGGLPQRVVYMYNRWRLQRAFFYKKNQKKNNGSQSGNLKCDNCYDCRCDDWHCYDCFPGGHCCNCPPTYDDSTVTLGDLEKLTDGKPLFISNVVANNWRKDFERKYCLLTMSSKGISVIDRQPGEIDDNRPTTSEAEAAGPSHPSDEFITSCLKGGNFAGKLKPKEIKLSSAMAMSAAAVSPYLGKNEDVERQFTHFFSVFGVEMATDIVYNMTGERGNSDDDKAGKYCSYFVNLFVLALILVLALCGVFRPSFPFTPLSVATTTSLVLAIIGVCLVLALSFLCSCNSNCSCEDCKGWFVVHVPIFRFLRSLLSIITYGETPSALLHLSDGGHFENYGLLALLKMRLPKILVLHGSEIKSDEDYAKDIINGMKKAREMFGCSFTAKDGGDVLTDLMKNYVHCTGTPPRKYEFQVRYSDGTTGEIALIAPRPPTSDGTERQAGEVELSALANSEWADFLKEGDVKDIQGCPGGIGCCECCHGYDIGECCRENCCGCCCENCFKFPRHPTANQFFTPKMFTAYHKEGYTACVDCDEFLGINSNAN